MTLCSERHLLESYAMEIGNVDLSNADSFLSSVSS